VVLGIEKKRFPCSLEMTEGTYKTIKLISFRVLLGPRTEQIRHEVMRGHELDLGLVTSSIWRIIDDDCVD
jgi:hypothetical protein